MEFHIAQEGMPLSIGYEGATVAYYGSEIEFIMRQYRHMEMIFFLPNCRC